MLVDIHAHLDIEPLFSKLNKVLFDCQERKIKTIISNGTSPFSNRKVLEISKQYPIVKPAFGLYPIEANEKEGVNVKLEFIDLYDKEIKEKGVDITKLSEKQINEIFETNFNYYIDEELKFITKFNKEIAAIGEVGLDLYWTKETKYQLPAFKKIIGLANKINKPLIVHSRDAEELTYQTLKSHDAKNVIIHCFGGDLEVTKKMHDDGYYFSIPATVVRNSKLQKLVQMTDLNKILTETDSPFLSPVPKTTNYPYNVIESIKKIAEIKGLHLDETKHILYENYKKVFNQI